MTDIAEISDTVPESVVEKKTSLFTNDACKHTIPLFDYSGIAKEHSTTMTCEKILTGLNVGEQPTCQDLRDLAKGETSPLKTMEEDFDKAYDDKLINKSFGGIANMVADNCMKACYDTECE
jgi:hypothetical protein